MYYRDPEVFANPNVFNPDRFTENGQNDRHKCSYLGFGEGPRICPGIKINYYIFTFCIKNVFNIFRYAIWSDAK